VIARGWTTPQEMTTPGVVIGWEKGGMGREVGFPIGREARGVSVVARGDVAGASVRRDSRPGADRR
jgi:hypothetical protein